MKYKVILFDADETLFDFKKSEREAFKNTMIEFNIEYDENYHFSTYKEINTAIYTMMGLRIIYYTFEKLDINIDKYLNLEEAADLIIKNIKENVLT